MFHLFKTTEKPSSETPEKPERSSVRLMDNKTTLDPRAYQRRKFARITEENPVRFWLLRRDKRPVEPGFSAVTRNLSGGGVLFVVESIDYLFVGRFLNVRVTLPKEEPIYAQGIVVRTQFKGGYDRLHEVAVAFTEIADADQKRIVRYIFGKQLDRRRGD